MNITGTQMISAPLSFTWKKSEQARASGKSIGAKLACTLHLLDSHLVRFELLP